MLAASLLILGANYFRTSVFQLLSAKMGFTLKRRRHSIHLDDWLTVHHSITLTDLQLDAQNSYLFIYNTFTKTLYMFRALPCSSSGGLHRNRIYMQPLVASLSAGDCLEHRLRKNSFLTGAQDSYLQRVTIPEAAYIYNYDVGLLKMSRVMLETCRGF